MPGQTRTLAWVPSRVGIYPFYCTDFCSALHQEMQGYIRVSARDSKVALKWNSPSYAQNEEHEAKEHDERDEHGTN
jgi:nitrous-oxide reductase